MGVSTYITDAKIEDLQRLLPTTPTPRAPRPYTAAWWGHPCCTLGEVAKELGISRERARQMETAALRKLRAWCEAAGLQLDDLIR